MSAGPERTGKYRTCTTITSGFCRASEGAQGSRSLRWLESALAPLDSAAYQSRTTRQPRCRVASTDCLTHEAAASANHNNKAALADF
jgi:hypothetical protein